MESVLSDREWIAAGRFTVADIMMADVFRQTRRADAPAYPNIRAYKERVCARPAFQKVYDDQVAHFIEGDRTCSKRLRSVVVGLTHSDIRYTLLGRE